MCWDRLHRPEFALSSRNHIGIAPAGLNMASRAPASELNEEDLYRSAALYAARSVLGSDDPVLAILSDGADTVYYTASRAYSPDNPPALALDPTTRSRNGDNSGSHDDVFTYDNDDLQFLLNNTFSSPSFVAPTSPPQPRDFTPDIMPPARRRTAASGAAASAPAALASSTSSAPASSAPASSAAAPALAESSPSGSPSRPTAAAINSPSSWHAPNGTPTTSPPARAASFRAVPSRAAPRRASQSPTASRTSAKRRRDGEDATATLLPPISPLLRSIGNSSGDSQGSSSQGRDTQGSSSSGSSGGSGSSGSNSNSQMSRPRISPKRPMRQETIIVDDDDIEELFGLGDHGNNDIEIVNLTNVDRPAPPADATADAGGGDGGDEEKDADNVAASAAETGDAAAASEPNMTRLAKFQCVICMDYATNLTVTHCGHLFCGECLHASLTNSVQQNICPMCRTKIETRTPTMSASKMARSSFPLQLKLRPSNRQGKRPMQNA